LFANRIRNAYATLGEMQHRDAIANAEFDTMCFGDALPQRVLDPRVVRAIGRIGQFSGEPVTAAGCAAEAGLSLSGAALASDAFFPFRDGVDLAAKSGISSVIQPGGSMRDSEVIAAADEHNLAMVYTGLRHFRH
jgi:hypothetical protein